MMTVITVKAAPEKPKFNVPDKFPLERVMKVREIRNAGAVLRKNMESDF